MKRKITLFIAAAALSGAALVAAAFGDTSSAAPPQASKGTLVALGKTALGKVLVDARGRTLYLFEKDKHGKSACYGACATLLAATTRPREASAGERRPRLLARRDQADRRQAAGDLRRTPALLVRRRQESEPNNRRRPHGLRRRLGCRLGDRPRSRTDDL